MGRISSLPTVMAKGAAVLSVLAVTGILYSTLPPSPDQWFLNYTGWMVTRGAAPYRDLADGNWPACHWLHAASTVLFGNTQFSWRIFDYLLMLASTSCGAVLAARLWGRSAGLWMLLLYPALYVTSGMWFVGERDIVGGNLLFIALLCYWNGLSRRSRSWQVLTGMAIAICTLIKPTFSLFGLFLALHAAIAVLLGLMSFKEAFIHLFIICIASFGVLAAGLGVVVLEGASPATFWEMAVVSIVTRFGNDTGTPWGIICNGAAYLFRCIHWILVGALLSLGFALWRGGRKGALRNLLFPMLWLTGAASYIVQAQGLGYTLGIVYAATIPIMCSGLGLICDCFRSYRWPGKALACAAILIALGGTAKKWMGTFGSSIEFLSGRMTLEEHNGRYKVGDGLTVAEAVSLSAELERKVPPQGTILVWGRANAVNFLSRRPQPTRFHHNVVIIRPYLPDELKRRWNAWFEEDLERNRPMFCLVNQRELNDLIPIPESARFLKRYLERSYTPERRIGESVLYSRKD